TRILRIRNSGSPDGRVGQNAIGIRRIVPQKEFMRLRVKVVDLALRHRQACVHVDPIRFHSPDRARTSVAYENLPVFTARCLENDGAEFPVVKSLVALEHCRNLSDLYRRLLLRVRLYFENVDRVSNATSIRMAHEDTVAGNAQA